MRKVYIVRGHSTEQGTIGVMSIPDLGFSCYVMELPWKGNRKGVSCVPADVYLVKIRRSPKYGQIFHLQDVCGRTYILIHSGNFAGDVSKGWKSHSMGCILLGKMKGELYVKNKGYQKAVLNSRITLKRFMKLLNNQPFKLIIK